MKIVGLIPARSGSKGVPKKNTRYFCGKPLIAHTIEQGLRVRQLDRLIVSTDSRKISKIAQYYGAEVPFLRPKEFAADSSTDFSVVMHLLQWLENNENYIFDMLVYLRPTCIFRNIESIEKAIIKGGSKHYDSIRSISLARHPPFWMFNLRGDLLTPLLKHDDNYKRRQDLPNVYQPNGTFEIIKRRTLVEGKTLHGEKQGYIIDNEYATLDIDTELDFRLAEAQYKILLNKSTTL